MHMAFLSIRTLILASLKHNKNFNNIIKPLQIVLYSVLFHTSCTELLLVSFKVQICQLPLVIWQVGMMVNIMDTCGVKCFLWIFFTVALNVKG